MPAASVLDRLLEGRQALEASRWADARDAFEAELAVRETPDARDGLGQALWFLGLVARRNEATDGSLLMHAEYLVAVGRKSL